MDVDVLTFKERQTLMKQGKCFKCRKTGHRVADCPKEEDRKRKKKEEPKKEDSVKNAFATIRALMKDERAVFAKIMLEGKEIFELEDWINVSTSFYYDQPCTSS